MTDTQPLPAPPLTPSDAQRLATLVKATRDEMAQFSARLEPFQPKPAEGAPSKSALAGKVAVWLLVINGALGLAADVAAQLNPKLAGPLQTLQHVVEGLQQ